MTRLVNPGQRRVHRPVAAALAAMAVGVLVLAPAAVLAADPVTIAFASDTTWTVEDADAGIGPALSLPGSAQQVCLNASFPDPCPSGATAYGWAGGGWGASLAEIPGASWIWAPGIDGASSPADGDTYRFLKTIAVPGAPQSGSLSFAADDGAEVFVNGTSAGSSSGQGSLATLDISALLVEGDNTIVVVGSNGVQCGQACAYETNPAGVVFGGSISYAPAAVTPAPSAGATARPALTPPPTSTLDPGPAVPSDGGLTWVLLLGTSAILAVLGISRRVERRQR